MATDFRITAPSVADHNAHCGMCADALTATLHHLEERVSFQVQERINELVELIKLDRVLVNRHRMSPIDCSYPPLSGETRVLMYQVRKDIQQLTKNLRLLVKAPHWAELRKVIEHVVQTNFEFPIDCRGINEHQLKRKDC